MKKRFHQSLVENGIKHRLETSSTATKIRRHSMRAIIEIFLAILFTVISGTTVLNFSSKAIKKEALLKVQKGLPSLEKFTEKLIRKN